ncbi:MAG: serine/threonine-protein kinase [Pseudomonadota bacterium]
MAEPPRFDGCEVVETIHTGAISELYSALQRPLGRPVLIKAIGASILPSSPFAATLEREARLLAELDHPNIVQLYDFVRRDDRMWMVLEHVAGWSLAEVLARGRLAPAAAVAVTLEVAHALRHAHEKGISHRDVQPRNILLSRRGDVKLTNFSVASAERLDTAPELLDGGGAYVGPSYMAPEQILGEPPDPRSDLFSLGVVLYEMLSGERPFKAADEHNEALRIRSEPPPPLARRVPGLGPGLERLILRCLEKMPSDRYEDANQLVEALEAQARELGVTDTKRAVRSALASLGLVPEEARDRAATRLGGGDSRARPWSFGRASLGVAVAAIFLVGGMAAIQAATGREATSSGTRGGSARLELVPENVGYLRVVADPWAHVIVDGQHVDTTPFARAIPLASGTHYVRLEHPNAPPERRTVELLPGKTVLLDVTMKLTGAAPEGSAAPEASAAPPAPSASAAALP